MQIMISNSSLIIVTWISVNQDEYFKNVSSALTNFKYIITRIYDLDLLAVFN